MSNRNDHCSCTETQQPRICAGLYLGQFGVRHYSQLPRCKQQSGICFGNRRLAVVPRVSMGMPTDSRHPLRSVRLTYIFNHP